MPATDIIKADPRDITSRVDEFSQVAKLFADSGMFADVKGAAQCFVKIMAGAEMGIPPFTAMNSFHVIQGKATMAATAIAARVKGSGRYNYEIVKKTAEVCELKFFENGRHVHTEVWDAKRAAKAGTKNMDKYPDAMLFARAITAGARAVCPDVIGQFYSPEEMGATVDESGVILDATPTQPTNGKAPDAPPHADTGDAPPTIDALVEHAQAMIDTPPTDFKRSQFDALKAMWREVWGQASEAGMNPEPVADPNKPSAYYAAIVKVGQAIIAARAEAKQADALPF